MKLKGLKKAIGTYQRANAGGYYSANYGKLMLNTETGEIWTDEFYSLDRNSWVEYHSKAIIDLGGVMSYYDMLEENRVGYPAESKYPITMKGVQDFVNKELEKTLPSYRAMLSW